MEEDTFSSPVVSENPQSCGDLLLFSGQSRQISPHFRLYGGARSLALTLLQEVSLLTGKNTGNLRFLAAEKSHHDSLDGSFGGTNRGSRLKSEQGINRRNIREFNSLIGDLLQDGFGRL
jgi:hypothetical protein